MKDVKKTLSEGITRILSRIIEICDKCTISEHARQQICDEEN